MGRDERCCKARRARKKQSQKPQVQDRHLGHPALARGFAFTGIIVRATRMLRSVQPNTYHSESGPGSGAGSEERFLPVQADPFTGVKGEEKSVCSVRNDNGVGLSLYVGAEAPTPQDSWGGSGLGAPFRPSRNLRIDFVQDKFRSDPQNHGSEDPPLHIH
jgi:hypothetical protein